MSVVSVPEQLLAYRAGGREKMVEEAVCRMCEEPSRRLRGDFLVRKMSRHHLVPQAWFEANKQLFIRSGFKELSRVRDCDANIIPICTHCHADVESPRDDGARRMLRKVLAKEEAAFAIAVRGQDWFDARYPPSQFAPDRWKPSASLKRVTEKDLSHPSNVKRQAPGKPVEDAFKQAEQKKVRARAREQFREHFPQHRRRALHLRDCRPGKMCVASCPVWLEYGYPHR